MPIPAEHRHYYPADWPVIARRIKEAADWRCVKCGRQCYRPGEKATDMRYVLTVAHLIPASEGGASDESNCRAWCAPCHLRYDQPMHARRAAETRRRKRMERGQVALPDVGGVLMSALPSEAPSPRPAPRRPWTARETALLRAHYDGDDSAAIDALAAVLRRSRHSVVWRAAQLGVSTPHARWTAEEKAYLRAHYATTSIAHLAAHFAKTPLAVQRQAQRLGVRQRGSQDGFTVREIGGLMGVPHLVVLRQWIRPCRLPSVRQRVKTGPAHTYVVREAAFLRFLRQRPFDYDWRLMPWGYYQKIARAASEAAGYLSVDAAAARLGLSENTVRGWCRRGKVSAARGALAADTSSPADSPQSHSLPGRSPETCETAQSIDPTPSTLSAEGVAGQPRATARRDIPAWLRTPGGSEGSR